MPVNSLGWACLCLALLAGLSVMVTPARAQGMMATCKAEIQTHCSAIPNGRGRITACLYAHSDKLTLQCRGEVDGIVGSKLSTGIREMAGTEGATEYRAACIVDTPRLCSNVPEHDDRVLACLYSVRPDGA